MLLLLATNPDYVPEIYKNHQCPDQLTNKGTNNNTKQKFFYRIYQFI